MPIDFTGDRLGFCDSGARIFVMPHSSKLTRLPVKNNCSSFPMHRPMNHSDLTIKPSDFSLELVTNEILLGAQTIDNQQEIYFKW